MKEIWDERYASVEYAFGTEPNEYFQKTIIKLQLKGDVLLPAEGEGRNAVFASKLGMKVTAFDISEVGKKKAMELAKKNDVEFEYFIGDFKDLDFKNQKYDVIGLIYAQFPEAVSSEYHKKLVNQLKPNGVFIIEGFSQSHAALKKRNPSTKGPGDLGILYSINEIKSEFKDLEILDLKEEKIILNAGVRHQGEGFIIRFTGKKLP